MKRDPVQQKLDALSCLRGQPRTPEAVALLRRSLSDRSNFVVAAAAEALTESDPPELLGQLVPAFEPFMKDPAHTDKGCKAKAALAAAVHRTEPTQPPMRAQKEFFLRGLHHRQPEPIWGGSVDTAVELRGTCALGLARLGYQGVVSDLGELLADPERGARAAAARAVGCAGLPEGVPLLRFKALTGDEDPQVLVECFAALLCLEPRESLPFLRRFLFRKPGKDRKKELVALPKDDGDDDGDETAEAAALALGHSRLDEALPLLIEYGESLPPGRRRVALLALATLRSPAAIDHLLSIVGEGQEAAAIQAVEALAMHRYDPTLLPRVEKVLGDRSSKRLRETVDRTFGAP